MLKMQALSIEASAHSLYVSIAEQKLYHYCQGELQRVYTISTSRKPPSCQENSLGTPNGLHIIAEKIGDGCEKGMVFKARVPQGKRFDELSAEENEKNLITSRILRLKGMEEGLNAGDGCDSYKRFIYIHGAPDTERQTNNCAASVSNGRDAMQCALDARAVIRVEISDAFHDMVKFGAGEFRARKHDLIFNKTRSGNASEVEYDFEEQVAVVCLFHRVADVRREHIEEGVEVVGDF